MKKYILFVWGLAALVAACGKKQQVFNEIQQGNMYLRNGKVYFQKSYNSVASFSGLEKKLMALNVPERGFQVKNVETSTMNGVIVNYQLNWYEAVLNRLKIPVEMKKPANASFEVEKLSGAYKVTVNNIWFADVINGKKQSNVTLESLVTNKDGMAFNKSRQNIKVLNALDAILERTFQMQGVRGDNRF